MKYCKRCVTPASRPRLEFDENGVCNACNWHEKKQKEIDWGKRQEEFKKICNKYRNRQGFDCIVPVSGGKDGSYVAWKMKHHYNMHPLCITFAPQMQTWLGRQNLDNFKQSGFDHIFITPDARIYKEYAKEWFIRVGMPKQPFVVGISTSVLRMAALLNIDLVIWGEQGEAEYGGSSKTSRLKKFHRDFLINYYYEGQKDSEKHGPWWKIPSQKQLNNIVSTWWSIYEDWDPDEHARLAKEKCGLQMVVGGSIGTFTNASQLDDVMQDLHAYLMFIKFGFGRCTSDASIEIRRGRMSRNEGVKVVNDLDGLFPLEYLDAYLDYFDMSKSEFWKVINKFANKRLLAKTDKPEKPWVLKKPVH